MNNYPEAFNINCAKSLACDTPGSGCRLQNVLVMENKNNKLVNKTSKLVKKRDITKEYKINNNKIYNHRTYNTTLHCTPYQPIKTTIQNRNIDFPSSNSRNWSNQRSYGNIVLGTSDSCNNIYGKVKPWNRIEKLNCPYNTNVDVNMAWNLNRVKIKRNR